MPERLSDTASRLALLLEHLADVLERTGTLAEAHAMRPSPYIDASTRQLELRRAARAHAYARQARANAESVRRRLAGPG